MACHNKAFTRLGGIAAVVRIDNTKIAVARGAEPWGVINKTDRRYALGARFHVDPCLPHAPAHKGEVEHLVRAPGGSADPTRQPWRDLAELQAWTDEHLLALAHRRRCPATGMSVCDSWQAERRYLGPLPIPPQRFDAVATRTVNDDCLVSFEGWQYSVPFAWVGQSVELRGGAGTV